MIPVTAAALDDARVEVSIADGVRFVAETDQRYDLVIVDSTDPVGPAAVELADRRGAGVGLGDVAGAGDRETGHAGPADHPGGAQHRDVEARPQLARQLGRAQDGINRAGLLTLPTQQAVFDVEDGFLGNGRRKRNPNRPMRS